MAAPPTPTIGPPPPHPMAHPVMPPGMVPQHLHDTLERQRRRFELECEFVQTLGNPQYLNYLAQQGWFKEQHNVNYLKYLQYWRRPEYARWLKYPQCLLLLEALQSASFREAIASPANAKFIEDQMLLQWLYYIRKRQRLYECSSAAPTDEPSATAGTSSSSVPASGSRAAASKQQ